MLAALLLLILCPLDAALPPLASDVRRFPQSEAETKAKVDLADSRVEWLKTVGHRVIFKVMRWGWIEDVPVESLWLEDARWREQCWRALWQAKRGTNATLHLETLRELIGREAYAMGLMPSPLPWVSP